MEVQIVDHSDPEMVRRKVKAYLQKGWKKNGDLKQLTKHIQYKVLVTKSHPSKTYYQELVKEDI